MALGNSTDLVTEFDIVEDLRSLIGLSLAKWITRISTTFGFDVEGILPELDCVG